MGAADHRLTSDNPQICIMFVGEISWNFEGLMDMATVETVERFVPLLPALLRRPPAQWPRHDVMSHFECAWSLLAWSGFERRFRQAEAP